MAAWPPSLRTRSRAKAGVLSSERNCVPVFSPRGCRGRPDGMVGPHSTGLQICCLMGRRFFFLRRALRAPIAQRTKDRRRARESPNLQLATSYLTLLCLSPRLSRRHAREPDLGCVCDDYRGRELDI